MHHVISHIGSDGSASGSQYSPSGSPTLAHLIHQAASEIPHPTDPTRTLWDAMEDVGPYFGKAHADSLAAYAASKQVASHGTGVMPLGSGSDFMAFLQRLGVRSVDVA